jgi:hypothetical protein
LVTVLEPKLRTTVTVSANVLPSIARAGPEIAIARSASLDAVCATVLAIDAPQVDEAGLLFESPP